MRFRFSAVKSISDPAERALRLAALYRHFESTADSQVSEAQESAATGTAQATRPGHSIKAGTLVKKEN